MSENLSFLAICGSLRKGSLNRMIANTLPDLAPADVSIVQAASIKGIPVYDADEHNSDGFPEAVVALADQIRRADGVVIVSPEYNFSVPGGLKNAIDWISRLPDQPFKNKPVALQSAAGGMLGGARMQYHLRQVMVFLDAVVFTKPEVFVSFAKNKVDESTGKLTDPDARKIIAQQLEGFTGFTRRLTSD
jgi:chromate reductase